MREQQGYQVGQFTDFGGAGFAGAVAQELDALLAVLEAFVQSGELRGPQIAGGVGEAVGGVDERCQPVCCGC